jgi:hypothetical protein
MDPYSSRVLVLTLTISAAASLGMTVIRPSDASLLRYWWGIVGAALFLGCSLLSFGDYRKRGGSVPLVCAIIYSVVALSAALVSGMMLLFGRKPL